MRLDDLKVEYRSLEDQTTVAKNAYTQVLDSLNKTTTSKGLDYGFRSVRSTTPHPTTLPMCRTRRTSSALVSWSV